MVSGSLLPPIISASDTRPASPQFIPRRTQYFCWVSVGWSLNHSSYVLPSEGLPLKQHIRTAERRLILSSGKSAGRNTSGSGNYSSFSANYFDLLAIGNLKLTNNLHAATLIWCHLVYLRERGENGQETDSCTRKGPANKFRGGKEPRSSESLMD